MVASTQAIDLVRIAASAASNKAAQDPIALDVSEKLPFADAFLIISGRSERNVSAIADSIEEALLPLQVKAIRREGHGDGRWELLDFGFFIAHVFHEDDRMFYGLERLWGDCPVIELPDAVAGDRVDDEDEDDEFAG